LLKNVKGEKVGKRDGFKKTGKRGVKKFPPPPLQGKTPKEVHAILTETLGEHAPSYATVKHWVTHFKCGDFSNCDATCPGRPKTVTTPELLITFTSYAWKTVGFRLNQ